MSPTLDPRSAPVLAAAAGVVALAAALALATSALSPADATPQSLEGQACYTGFPAFEPSLGSTSGGALFVQANTDATVRAAGVGGPDREARTGVVRSLDGCGSWQDVTPTLGTDGGAGAPGANATSPQVSFDPIVTVDPAADRVFNLDMTGTQCNWISYSDDLGETWEANPLGCGQPMVIQDHPTLFAGPPGPEAPATDEAALEATGYPSLVYVCASRALGAGCARSLDGGATFGPWRPVVFEDGGDACLLEGGVTGHGVAGPEGRVFVGTQGCRDRPVVARSLDDGLTWEATVLSEDRPTRTHDVELAVDEAGNAYAVWPAASDRVPQLAVSTDGGDTWREPVSLGPHLAGLGLETTSFVNLAAGSEGRIVLTYYGTPAQERIRSVPSGSPWGAYLTVSTDATGSSPTFATAAVNASGDPVAKGPCSPGSFGAGRCDGVGDFVDVIVDPTGDPAASLVDVCNGACASGASDDDEGVRGFVGRLASGPDLRVDG